MISVQCRTVSTGRAGVGRPYSRNGGDGMGGGVGRPCGRQWGWKGEGVGGPRDISRNGGGAMGETVWLIVIMWWQTRPVRLQS